MSVTPRELDNVKAVSAAMMDACLLHTLEHHIASEREGELLQKFTQLAKSTLMTLELRHAVNDPSQIISREIAGNATERYNIESEPKNDSRYPSVRHTGHSKPEPLIVSNDNFEDGLQRELDEACDVKGCGKRGAGHLSLKRGGKVWLCMEHEP